MRKECASDKIIFEIENIIEETNNDDTNSYKVTNELNEFNKNGRSNDNGQSTKRTVQQPGSTDITRRKGVSKKPRFLAR